MLFSTISKSGIGGDILDGTLAIILGIFVVCVILNVLNAQSGAGETENSEKNLSFLDKPSLDEEHRNNPMYSYMPQNIYHDHNDEN